MLKIGIIGHRDLKKTCIKYYKKQINILLQSLQQKHKKIIIYSPLADGADRLIVHEAINLKIPFIVILPMDEELYINDFTEDSKIEFDLLLKQAFKIKTMPLQNNSTQTDIMHYGYKRDLQYKVAGEYIAKRINILVALWDGKDTELVGGTSETIKLFLQNHYGKLYHLLVSRECDLTNNMVKFTIYKNTG